MERSAARAAFEHRIAAALVCLRTLRDAFFTICLAVSLSHTVRWMPQVRGKMIKKTAGPLSKAKIASGGGPKARMKTATAASSNRQLAACKTLACPALLPKRSPRRARAQGISCELVSTHLESLQSASQRITSPRTQLSDHTLPCSTPPPRRYKARWPPPSTPGRPP